MIAIDAMGGDYAPHAILKGALCAAQNQHRIILCGPEKLLTEVLDGLDPQWKDLPLYIHDAPDVIAMDDDPVMSCRKKPHSSLVQAVKLVKEGKATHAMSAGNSGALVIASIFILGRQEHCERPAIAGFLPTPQGSVFALDLGANTEVRPQHLYQFALIGAHHIEQSYGKEKPSVGLLANGHEPGKGSLIVREAHDLLLDAPINFIGNVEPYHIFNQEVDIVVCDGFSGNILLKTMEAVYKASMRMMVHGNYISSDDVATVIQRLDPRIMGGARLLGVKGNVIVCHGGADDIAIYNAVKKIDSLHSQCL
jgi:glycerol-3-phosphate acyltransferase PlsX